MWSFYRLGYLCIAALVMGGVVFVAAAAEHASAGRPLNLAGIVDALKAAADDDGTEKGNLSEAGGMEMTKQGDYLAALVASGSKPVLVFKHSTECTISGGAYRRTAEWLRELGEAAPPVFLVKVIEHRTISEFIAKQTGVKHESPQAIVLNRGRAVWNTSHEDITAESLGAAFDSIAKVDAEAPDRKEFDLSGIPPTGPVRGALTEAGATELLALADWEAAVERSHETLVLIFKHGTSCGHSGDVYRAVAHWLVAPTEDRLPVYGVRVRESRPVSNEIERLLGIKHESPQAILMRKGRAVWDADHHEITPAALDDAIAEFGAGNVADETTD